MTKGQLEVERTAYQTYKVNGGVGGGASVTLHECTNKSDAKIVMEFIATLRGYPDRLQQLVEWVTAVTFEDHSAEDAALDYALGAADRAARR